MKWGQGQREFVFLIFRNAIQLDCLIHFLNILTASKMKDDTGGYNFNLHTKSNADYSKVFNVCL